MKLALFFPGIALIGFCALTSLGFAQDVTIDLEPVSPPIQIPASGGSFNYNATLTNVSGSSQTFGVWIMVLLPNGAWYGPVLGPVTLTLPAGASLTRERTQAVPAGAPAGTYLYEGRVGIYPSNIWDSDSFTFEKLAVGGGELWVARYNGPGNGPDYACSMAVDGGGNAYVTGWSAGSGTSFDYATVKYDASGTELWAARYNGPVNNSDQASSIALDGGGNAYVTGLSAGSGTSYDYATIKYDASGNELWAARYNGLENSNDYARSIAVDGGGNAYVTGESNGSGTSYDYATVKYDASGNQLWVARYNGPGNSTDDAYSIALDGGGNIYVTGFSYGSGTSNDYATVKYDASGNELWAARYNGPANNTDQAYSIAVDGGGNAYVTGKSYGSGTSYDYATIKYDASGNQLWVARYNGPGNGDDGANSIAVNGGGNAYITGWSLGSGTSYDYATVKYDASGNQLWAARYNGPANSADAAYSIAVDGSGNACVTGHSAGSGNYDDYATIKYDASGNQLWVARYNGPGNDNDGAHSIAVDGGGNAYVTGESKGSGTSYDYATVKYSGGNPAAAGSDWMPGEALVFGEPLLQECRLEQNYPNPFNPLTTITFFLPQAGQVTLAVYDLQGRLVAQLVNGMRPAGVHEVTWDASQQASGMYFCRIQAGDFTAIKKMMLVK